MKHFFKKTLAVLAVFAAVTACSPIEPPDAAMYDEDPYERMNAEKEKADSEGFNDYDLTDRSPDTDLNPNFLDIGTGGEDTGIKNIGTDQDMLRSVVERMDEFNPKRVSIVGENAFVTATFTRKFTREERRMLKDELEERLTGAMPRYNVNLKVEQARD
ncbi:hypothetical protein [Bacillus marinisedimentorum]|uniref:hypothetical protein n=1 Tax=Bacillus marinisedimentorum TaxID=1821260 RepID=UPI0007E0FACB|nr:hypothetical protein [Bacillus marinisedimentorum]